MAYSLKLDHFSHDLMIKKGSLQLVSGSDEVRQRIKVSLWHHKGEYFLNPESGMSWYSEILGFKPSNATLVNIIRDATLEVPGVLNVDNISLNRVGRSVSISIICRVQKGLYEISDGVIAINGMSIGESR